VYSKEKPLYQRPLAYAAAIGIIALLSAPFLFDNTEATKPALAEVQKEQQKSSPEAAVKKQEAAKEEPKTFTQTEGQRNILVADAEIIHVANDEVYAMESVSLSEVAVIEPTLMSRSMADQDWSHSDGIFKSSDKEADDATASTPISAHPSVLDLLTATF
jgi:ribosomal protein S25